MKLKAWQDSISTCVILLAVNMIVHTQIESGPLEEQQIAFIIAEVIKGLDYLHSLGVCHGDIVSHQVMLTPQGEVKLAGFHLATDKLDTMQLTGTVDREDSGYKVK